MQPEGGRPSNGADPSPTVRDCVNVGASDGQPETAKIFLECTVNLPRLKLLALGLLYVQFSFLGDLNDMRMLLW